MFNLETTWNQEKNRICDSQSSLLKCSGLEKAAPYSQPSFDPFSFHFNRIIHHRDPAHYFSPHVKAHCLYLITWSWGPVDSALWNEIQLKAKIRSAKTSIRVFFGLGHIYENIILYS